MNKRASSSEKFYLFKLKDGSRNWLKVKFSFGGGGLKGRENVDAGAAWAEISHQMFPQRVASAEAPSERTLPFKVNFWPGVKEREREEGEGAEPSWSFWECGRAVNILTSNK